MIQATVDSHRENPSASFARPASACGRHRLLIPINANADSRWGIDYALQLQRDGQPVEVCFLNVGEPISQWEVLRFRPQGEITRFQSERAQSFIDEASHSLLEQGIPCRGFFRQGRVVHSILDVAAELECDEIVMPRPHAGIFSLFSREIVGTVMRKIRAIPLVLVSQSGSLSGADKAGPRAPRKVPPI
jgi:nucleotide-binding universal stress UspA family protein